MARETDPPVLVDVVQLLSSQQDNAQVGKYLRRMESLLVENATTMTKTSLIVNSALWDNNLVESVNNVLNRKWAGSNRSCQTCATFFRV